MRHHHARRGEDRCQRPLLVQLLKPSSQALFFEVMAESVDQRCSTFVSSRSARRRISLSRPLTLATIYSSEFSEKRSAIRCVGSKMILPPSTTRTQSGRSLGKRAVQTPGKG